MKKEPMKVKCPKCKEDAINHHTSENLWFCSNPYCERYRYLFVY